MAERERADPLLQDADPISFGIRRPPALPDPERLETPAVGLALHR
jgi:hypothetical protein